LTEAGVIPNLPMLYLNQSLRMNLATCASSSKFEGAGSLFFSVSTITLLWNKLALLLRGWVGAGGGGGEVEVEAGVVGGPLGNGRRTTSCCFQSAPVWEPEAVLNGFILG